MSQFFIRSLIASLVLTLVLNGLGSRFPDQMRRLSERLSGGTADQPTQSSGGRSTRVMIPWKAMLVISVVGTILLNVFVR